MSGHTPGPWTVEPIEYGDEVTDDLCILGPSPNFRNIAAIARCFQGDRDQDMEQANAILIAAAPELLAALIAFEEFGNMMDVRKQISATIAKATGKA